MNILFVGSLLPRLDRTDLRLHIPNLKLLINATYFITLIYVYWFINKTYSPKQNEKNLRRYKVCKTFFFRKF